jgi:hypothetical protein
VDVAAVEAQPALPGAAGEQLPLLQQVRQAAEAVPVGLFDGGDQLEGAGDGFKALLPGGLGEGR